MKNTSTYLRVMSNLLSGRGKKIFPNQVVFYNAVFGATNPLMLPGEYLEGMNRVSQGRRLAEDEDLVKHVNYLLRSGLDSNSANIGKHINNAPELPIPKLHKVHFMDGENRGDIVHRLQAIIRFCLAFHPGRLRLETSDFKELLGQMKAELQEASYTLAKTDELSVELLANIMYEVLFSHLSQLQERFYPIPRGEEKLKVDLQMQRREYQMKVDCFGSYNIDKFFALKRLAETNVIAANELAVIYYYGCQYYEEDEGEGNNGSYRVEPDSNLAAYYFKKAVNCDPPVLEACWSLGYMIMNRMFQDIREEEADELAYGYFRYAAEQDYMPAYNSIGLMRLSRGDKLFGRIQELEAQGYPAGEEREEMLSCYCEGLELCDKAGCMGWVYGHINVADFLADRHKMDRIWSLIQDRVQLSGPDTLRERWQAAAALGNLWAGNQLAILECQLGNYDTAVEIWEEQADRQYPAASLNLALYIYGADAPREDVHLYQTYLEQASNDGSARGSYELAKLYVPSSPFVARMLLSRAEEQNYRKFNNQLYHQIKELWHTLEAGMGSGYRSPQKAF